MINEKFKSTIGRLFKTYIVDALSFMAMGLFCSLILGLIIKQIALIPGFDFLMNIAVMLQSAPVVGGSIGLPGIWVLVAVSVGGSLAGVIGMILFIPLFSVGYALLRDKTKDILKRSSVSKDKYQ